MSQFTEYYIVITALGRVRPGIINTITRHVSHCGCNIEDSRLALLGTEFTFIMLLSGSWNAIAQIESTLPVKAAELELLTVMKRTIVKHRLLRSIKILVQVEVSDSPHIIERFTNLFDSHQMSIAELISKTHLTKPTDYPTLHIQITAHSDSVKNTTIIQEDFYQLCTELNAQGNINTMNYPKNENKDGER